MGGSGPEVERVIIMASNVTINISPSPGFCIKSKVLHLDATSTREQTHEPVPISEGLKVFVNIAWSKDVPPPLDGIEKASGFAAHSGRIVSKSEKDSPIHVFASNGRVDTDKAGKPALVFDCVFHSSLKTRVLKDVEFKTFLVELSLQQIEAQNSISLSRTLGTPNILSKGKLEQRAVSIPSTLFPPGRHHGASVDKSPARKLIEEVADSPATASNVNNRSSLDRTPHSNSVPETPSWIWRQEGGEIHVTIRVPKLTHASIPSATLDLEPRRFTLFIPDLYALDVDLELPDGTPGKVRSGGDPQGTGYIATLKQARRLDVDRARAEWRVKERSLVIVA
ncbi:pre-RNA processing PIH1/Nop17-domain-containing protein [Russula aff. rugulosa BPL654]|nr:pre-RNA processing PIH1/Nop17-domain-containing protein [Russula aff. rugulosa BPL654]